MRAETRTHSIRSMGVELGFGSFPSSSPYLAFINSFPLLLGTEWLAADESPDVYLFKYYDHHYF